jgi:hypothetical protein
LNDFVLPFYTNQKFTLKYCETYDFNESDPRRNISFDFENGRLDKKYATSLKKLNSCTPLENGAVSVIGELFLQGETLPWATFDGTVINNKPCGVCRIKAKDGQQWLLNFSDKKMTDLVWWKNQVKESLSIYTDLFQNNNLNAPDIADFKINKLIYQIDPIDNCKLYNFELSCSITMLDERGNKNERTLNFSSKDFYPVDGTWEFASQSQLKTAAEIELESLSSKLSNDYYHTRFADPKEKVPNIRLPYAELIGGTAWLNSYVRLVNPGLLLIAVPWIERKYCYTESVSEWIGFEIVEHRKEIYDNDIIYKRHLYTRKKISDPWVYKETYKTIEVGTCGNIWPEFQVWSGSGYEEKEKFSTEDGMSDYISSNILSKYSFADSKELEKLTKKIDSLTMVVKLEKIQENKLVNELLTERIVPGKREALLSQYVGINRFAKSKLNPIAGIWYSEKKENLYFIAVYDSISTPSITKSLNKIPLVMEFASSDWFHARDWQSITWIPNKEQGTEIGKIDIRVFHYYRSEKLLSVTSLQENEILFQDGDRWTRIN